MFCEAVAQIVVVKRWVDILNIQPARTKVQID